MQRLHESLAQALRRRTSDVQFTCSMSRRRHNWLS